MPRFAPDDVPLTTMQGLPRFSSAWAVRVSRLERRVRWLTVVATVALGLALCTVLLALGVGH